MKKRKQTSIVLHHWNDNEILKQHFPDAEFEGLEHNNGLFAHFQIEGNYRIKQFPEELQNVIVELNGKPISK